MDKALEFFSVWFGRAAEPKKCVNLRESKFLFDDGK